MKKNKKSLQEFLPRLIDNKQQEQIKGGEDTIVIEDIVNT